MNRRSWLAVCSLFSLTACQNKARTGLIGEFRIGERAQVGPMIYNVFETQYMVKLGDGPDARIPQNRFLVVRLSAVNGGGAKADESIPTLSLIDDAGASFNELENGAGVPQWLGVSRKVRPAESVSANVVFDVAPRHYKLRIADDSDQNYALIDLPLTFGEQNGESAPPPPPSAVR